MREVKYYPAELFNANENITRKNMHDYDHKQNKLMREVLKLAPNYYQLDLRERMALRQRVLCGLN